MIFRASSKSEEVLRGGLRKIVKFGLGAFTEDRSVALVLFPVGFRGGKVNREPEGKAIIAIFGHWKKSLQVWILCGEIW